MVSLPANQTSLWSNRDLCFWFQNKLKSEPVHTKQVGGGESPLTNTQGLRHDLLAGGNKRFSRSSLWLEEKPAPCFSTAVTLMRVVAALIDWCTRKGINTFSFQSFPYIYIKYMKPISKTKLRQLFREHCTNEGGNYIRWDTGGRNLVQWGIIQNVIVQWDVPSQQRHFCTNYHIFE